MNNAPQSITELLERAQAIAGLSLQELANQVQIELPLNAKKEKGWTGQLIELSLGATAGSKPIQDFPQLGVELKSLPIDRSGRPLESTYVCMTQLLHAHGETWQQSSVRNKLSHVLWVPVLAERSIPIAQRIIGHALLWSPDKEEEATLRQDWEELMEAVAFGRVDEITARHGQALQLRPKAANSKVRTQAYGRDGQLIETLPRGFYLRRSFTQALLEKHFANLS
ncbi:DNA mismatch repair endonuclease MutH [Celerinatantimonas diazotrophica]|uniref:DNA mismatch repair protein MutH n=1 Tax=Celerinatantimonas diazotrophica TaxID=412034 RepID=A0A4R1J8X7_9GAMM|nr:DNA mismatch repair endonuclease MutH [Celerinatantimonas diazotrophica]TCK47028.1 DNA mismatch repair protein MutH [Celerinatantimonas diazotrophica]CAG9295796.1 DNA mismatch repair protein MutH [Celerinatantimonas diazotrophica]